MISAAFDSGNIEVVDAADLTDVQLRIRPDPSGDLQWFHFRITGRREAPCTLRLLNAGQASFPAAWPRTQAVVSADRQRWLRVPTTYADGVLTIRLTPETDAVWVALFAPYPLERHHRLLARAGRHPGVRVVTAATTLDGRSLDMLRFGNPEGPRIWIVARQHAGETMAAWWAEGLLDRLLDPADGLARSLLDRAAFCVVPCMNPDGSFRGHIRGNAIGTDLNRAWLSPAADTAPEVFGVLNHMKQLGVDLCLDVHGDEARPYNFVNGPDGIPSFTPVLAQQLRRFRHAYARADPHFQVKKGYPPSPPGQANLRLCTNAVAERFGCLAMTLEQPFTDVETAPDPITGWSPARARRLGASVLHPIASHLDDLG